MSFSLPCWVQGTVPEWWCPIAHMWAEEDIEQTDDEGHSVTASLSSLFVVLRNLLFKQWLTQNTERRTTGSWLLSCAEAWKRGVCVCTCLLRTGCCSPSNRRPMPPYLASSPIHFPSKSKQTRPTGKTGCRFSRRDICLVSVKDVKKLNEYLEYISSFLHKSSSPSSAFLGLSGGDCSHRKLCLEKQRRRRFPMRACSMVH